MSDVVMPIEVPESILAEAEELLASLPRKDWPDDIFSVESGWDLHTYTYDGDKRAKLTHKEGAGEEEVIVNWWDIQ